jgi:predicted TPR repeat methyltransferase
VAQDTSDAQSFEALESALAHHAQGDFARAVELYGAISPHSPSFQEGQYYLGVALHHLGQHQRAVDLLRAALAASGGRVDWANKVGNILTAQNRFAEAADIFEQAIAKAPAQALLRINLGAARERMGDFARAEQAYQAAISLEPESQEAYRLLSALYAGQQMELESVRAYCAGYIVSPRETTTPYLLGKAYYVLGRLDDAAEVYRQWREAEPDNPVPAHLFAACSSQDDGDAIPDRCSDDFEGKLSSLDYRGPDLLKRLMSAHFQAHADLHVLDAGCGTGLCAPILRPYAQSLDGVDLSGAMLEIAHQRSLYEALHQAEIGAFLGACHKTFDLIAPGGRLIFTSEICADNSKVYQLNPSGRYSHSVAYLRHVMEAAGFHCVLLDHEPLRTELQKPVAGVIVLAQRL